MIDEDDDEVVNVGGRVFVDVVNGFSTPFLTLKNSFPFRISIRPKKKGEN